jgi:apolipoprotein N-acyltransferase
MNMKRTKWYVDISLALATAFLLLFSFPTYNINVLGFIALIPIFIITYTQNTKRTLAYGIVSGFLFYCLYLFWMNAYLAVVGVTFVTVVYGGYFVIALLLINTATRAFPRYRVILTPFLWIAIEYIRSFGFLGFTFGSIGYTQHNFLRFIQIADIGGEPLVSFIIVLFNAGIADICVKLLEKKREIKLRSIHTGAYPLFVSIVLIIFSLIYGSFRMAEPLPTSPRMKLSLIQALSSPRTKWKTEKWKTLKRLTDFSEESYEENPDVDLIVWTETAVRTSLRPNLIYGSAYHMRIQNLIKQLNTYFIIGSPDNYDKTQKEGVDTQKLAEIYPGKEEEEIWTNSAYFLSNHGEIIGKYDKIQLTPFGEHFPIGETLPFLQKVLDKFTDSAGFSPGTENTVFHHEKLNFSVVICWEGTYGYLIRRFVNNGADFVLNISNDMWTQTRAGHFQHFTITKFRAIENRIWFARAANDGVTAITNPRGEVVQILPIKELGYLTGEVGPRVRRTFYTRFGDILPKVSLAVLALSFIFSIIFHWKKPATKKN